MALLRSALFLWLALVLPAAAAAEELFPADPRLSRPVTSTAPRARLGQYLENLSQEAGVPLKVQEPGGALSGKPVAVIIRERPLREVLAAFRTLFSTPFRRWDWKVAGDGYVLAPDGDTRDGRAAVEKRFRADLATYCEILRSIGARRVRLIKEHPELFPGGKEEGPYGELIRALTAEQVRDLVEGRELKLVAANLPARAAEALFCGRVPDPGEAPPDGTLWQAWLGTPETWHTAGPGVWLRNSGGSQVGLFGGSRWLGGFLRKEQPGWDYLDAFRLRAFYEHPRGPEDQPARVERAPTEEVLRQTAEEARISLVVDLHGVMLGTHSGPIIYPNAADALPFLSRYFECQYGREGPIGLLRPLNTAVDGPGGLVSWEELKRFREAVSRSGGFLDIPTLMRIGELSYAQLISLIPDYESVNVNTDQLREGGVWRAILAFFRTLPEAERERVLRGEAVPFSAAPEASQAALKDANEDYHRMVVAKLQANPEARVALRIEDAVIRVLNQPGQPEMQPGRNLVWEIRYPDGKVTTRKYPLQKLPIPPPR